MKVLCRKEWMESSERERERKRERESVLELRQLFFILFLSLPFHPFLSQKLSLFHSFSRRKFPLPSLPRLARFNVTWKGRKNSYTTRFRRDSSMECVSLVTEMECIVPLSLSLVLKQKSFFQEFSLEVKEIFNFSSIRFLGVQSNDTRRWGWWHKKMRMLDADFTNNHHSYGPCKIVV